MCGIGATLPRKQTGLTPTGYSSILRVTARGLSPSKVKTFTDAALTPRAGQVGHPHITTTFSILDMSCQHRRVPQHPADHHGIVEAPVGIIAHSPPCASIVDLHTTLSSSEATNQSHRHCRVAICMIEGKKLHNHTTLA